MTSTTQFILGEKPKKITYRKGLPTKCCGGTVARVTVPTGTGEGSPEAVTLLRYVWKETWP